MGYKIRQLRTSLVAQLVKNLPLIPELGRSPRAGKGYPLQCSCLENPMDRGAWQVTQSMRLQRDGHDRVTNMLSNLIYEAEIVREVDIVSTYYMIVST